MRSYYHTHLDLTRMHSSRMCTVSSSGRWSGGACIPACTGQGCVYRSMHLAGGVSAWGGVCPGGVYPGGVCPWGMSAQKVSAQGGCLLKGEAAWGVSTQGVSAWGCLPSACWDIPPMDRMTDACENITLPQLHCGW